MQTCELVGGEKGEKDAKAEKNTDPLGGSGDMLLQICFGKNKQYLCWSTVLYTYSLISICNMIASIFSSSLRTFVGV